MKSLKTVKNFIFVSLLSLLAVFIHGYSFTGGDQAFHIPFLLKTINNSLFPKDYLFTSPQINYSLFYKLLGYLIKISPFNTEKTYFILYLLIHTLLFWGIYQLAKLITKKESVAFVSVSMLLLPKYIGGSAIMTFDVSLTPRFFILPFVVFTLFFLLKKRYNLVSLLTGLVFILHPFSAVTLSFFTVAVLIYQKVSLKTVIKIVLFFLIITGYQLSKELPLIFQNIQPGTDVTGWYQIIRFRLPYNFLSLWKLEDWGNIVIYLFMFLIIIINNRSKNLSLLNLFVKMALVILVIDYFFSEIIIFIPLIQLQLTRIILLPVVLIFIYFADTIVSLFLTKSYLSKILSVLIFVSLSINYHLLTFLLLFSLLVFNRSFIRTKRKQFLPRVLSFIFISVLFLSFLDKTDKLSLLIYPRFVYSAKVDNYWEDIQLWSSNNTSLDSVFLVPPGRAGFRIYSKRSIIGDYKDGATGLYSKEFALDWNKRREYLSNYSQFEESDFLFLHKVFPFDYIVIEGDSRLTFPEVYQNDKFTIYRFNGFSS